MTENSIEYLDVKSPDEEIYADCWVVEDIAESSAQCFIYGPKRGDEIFSLVRQRLQETSSRNGLPLRHLYTSSNKGALALAKRTEGYSQVGKDKLGNDIFEKIYTPI